MCRINALAFAARHGLDEELVIAAFLHATQIGMFDISWNVLCPGCGGVLDTNASLKTVQKEEYVCALCAAAYRADPRRDGRGDLHRQPRGCAGSRRTIRTTCRPTEYFRQLYWGSGVDVPDEGYRGAGRRLHDRPCRACRPARRRVLSIQLPPQFVIVFEPVTHSAQFIDVKGEPTRERQTLSLILRPRACPQPDAGDAARARCASRLRTAPTRACCRPSSSPTTRCMTCLARRRPFLTAKRLLSNQTFRDLYRTDTLDVDQRLKITSLTFLFTDLRGSTELYERVGDLVAFDLVRAHFQVLHEIVAAEAGAVVKTIGDAVMATFPTPDRAVAAALRMREAMLDLNSRNGREDLLLKIGVHEGPCIAVTINERQDYFGQTVNIASRVQGLATAQSIFATGAVIGDSRTVDLLKTQGADTGCAKRLAAGHRAGSAGLRHSLAA